LLWKTTKSLLNLKEQIPSLTSPNRVLAYSDKEKADFLGEHLSNVFMPHSDILPDPELLSLTDKFLYSPFPVSLPAKPTSPNEIKFLLQNLKVGKASGYN